MDNIEQPTGKPVADQLTGDIAKFGFMKGFDWVTEGFDLFKKHWLMWAVSYLLFIVVAILISNIPIAGSLAASVLGAGLYALAQNTDKGQPFVISDILAGFKHALMPLIVLTIFNVIVFVVCFTPFVDIGMLTPENQNKLTDQQVFELLQGVLIALCLYLIPALAFIFSPIILVLHRGVSVYQAIALSFKACVINMMPFTAFGLAFIGLFLLSIFTMGLALLALMPIAICGLYAAHKDMYCKVSDSTENQPHDDEPTDVMSA